MSETKKIIEYAGKEEIDKLVENVNARLAAKINKSQGTENANKVLGIGSDGAVSPIDARPNWNENDESNPSFIKNRPFFRSDLIEKTILESSDISFTYYASSNYSMGVPSSVPTFSISDGAECTVIIDDVKHILNASLLGTTICIGNKSLLNSAYPNTGESFLVAYVPSSVMQIVINTDTANTTHNISVICKDYEYYPLSRQYLPEDAVLPEVNVNYNNYSELAVLDGKWEVIIPSIYNGDGSCSIRQVSSTASGNYSAAFGFSTQASGANAISEGAYTIASSQYQHAQGKYNIEDSENKYAHIIGNGTSSSKRSNAHTVDWNGNAWYQGDVYVGGTSQDDENAEKLVKESELVQSDWNQNDSTAIDYVKNRPFSREISEEIIFEQNIPSSSFSAQNGMCMAQVTGTKTFSENSIYNVIYDGTLYSNVTVSERIFGVQSIIIGNIDENNAPIFTTYPFVLVGSNDNYDISIVTNNTEPTSHDIKIVEIVEIIHELDEKYIPYVTGKKVEGQTFTILSEEIVAAQGAEIFNNYKSNIATGSYSHSEGTNTIAQGNMSHAEGSSCSAVGHCSHAEGIATYSIGESSHSEGIHTIASSQYQHVQGKYNIEDSESKYVHIVGNGKNDTARSNAHTLDWSGNAEYAGDVKANACGGENPVSLVEVAEKVHNVKEVFMITATLASAASDEGIATVAVVQKYTFDKTFAEILEAINKGCLPVLYMSDIGFVLNLVGCDDTQITFSFCVCNNRQSINHFFIIFSNDTYHYGSEENSLAPLATSANEGQILSVVNGVPTWIDMPTATDSEVTTMLTELGLSE